MPTSPAAHVGLNTSNLHGSAGRKNYKMEHFYSNLGPNLENSGSHFATQGTFYNFGGFLSVFDASS